MTIEKALIYRPQEFPSAGIPMGARSVGAAEADPGSSELRLGRPMVQVFWFVSGEGAVGIGDQLYPISGPTVVVYAPETAHDLRAGSRLWSWRYWTMDGPLAYDMCCEFGLKEGVYPASDTPHEQFFALAKAIGDISAQGERYASALAYQLLATASFPQQLNQVPVVRDALRVLDEEWRDPDLSIQGVAQRIGVHRSRLTRLFHHHQGMNPTVYLTAKRIQHAQSMLKQTEASIQEVASESGFADPSYFSRVFRQRCGMTPLQFRRSGIPRSL